MINRKNKYFLILFSLLLSFISDTKGSSSIPYLNGISKIEEYYGIVLSNEQIYWDESKILVLSQALDSIKYVNSGKIRLLIEDRRYKCGIDVYFDKGVKYASLSKDVFKYGSKRNSYEKRNLLSKALEKALLCLLTDFGENKKRVELFLQDRFSIYLGSHNHFPLTGQKIKSYKPFTPRERIIFLHTLMDLSPLIKVRPSWSLYLLRRKKSFKTSHRSHATTAQSHILSRHRGYIEFTDEAFVGPESHSKTIFIHEIMHFFVENIWKQSVLKQWANVGSWYRDRSDIDQWSTKEEKAFVSPYAHEHNPTEDLVESIAHYVVYPSYLKSIAPTKYHFIKNRLMKRVQYLSKTPSFTSFIMNGSEKLNTFPERVKKIKVISSSAHLKDIVLGIHLQSETGAKKCKANYVILKMYGQNKTPLYLRFFSNRSGSCYLVGKFELPELESPQYSKDWTLDSMQVYNSLGEVRFQSGSDFYFKLLAETNGKNTPSKYASMPLSRETYRNTKEKNVHYAFHSNDRLYPLQLILDTVRLGFTSLGGIESRLQVEFQVKDQDLIRRDLKKVHFYFSDPKGTRYRFVLSPVLIDEENSLRTYRVYIFFPKEIRGGVWSLQEIFLQTRDGLVLPYSFVDKLFVKM